MPGALKYKCSLAKALRWFHIQRVIWKRAGSTWWSIWSLANSSSYHTPLSPCTEQQVTKGERGKQRVSCLISSALPTPGLRVSQYDANKLKDNGSIAILFRQWSCEHFAANRLHWSPDSVRVLLECSVNAMLIRPFWNSRTLTKTLR